MNQHTPLSRTKLPNHCLSDIQAKFILGMLLFLVYGFQNKWNYSCQVKKKPKEVFIPFASFSTSIIKRLKLISTVYATHVCGVYVRDAWFDNFNFFALDCSFNILETSPGETFEDKYATLRLSCHFVNNILPF